MGRFVAVAAYGLAASVSVAQIDIPTITIGNPGNAPDPSTGNQFGAVSYLYNISITEVTNSQYVAFLNSVARRDPRTLYVNAMSESNYGGIDFVYTDDGLRLYFARPGRENWPVNYVSFWQACRFANWMHNGQPIGDQTPLTTEDGAYTLTDQRIAANDVSRNENWIWAVPSENEWYKAAFHQPASDGGDIDSYWAFPISSNSIDTTQANYTNGDSNWRPRNVGAYAPNYYGIYDLGGNLGEWNEGKPTGIEYRCTRGGYGYSQENGLRSSNRGNGWPSTQSEGVGFRLTRAYCLPPAIDAVSSDATTCIGVSTTFTVSATGSSPRFQWRKDGVQIIGATNAALEITPISASDAGVIDCVVSNDCGVVTSEPINLTVLVPQILTPPTSQSVNVDQPVLFALELNSLSPCVASLAFQWQRRNPLVTDPSDPQAWISLIEGGGFSGTQSPNLAIFRPTPGLATGYRCRISNACGCEADSSGVIYTDVVNYSAACPSDFNLDGSVDGDDVIMFFERWDVGC
jgi:formylglycine-generating enzyme required for sulfatase activity